MHHRDDMTNAELELLSSMLDKAERKLQEKSPLQISAEEYFVTEVARICMKLQADQLKSSADPNDLHYREVIKDARSFFTEKIRHHSHEALEQLQATTSRFFTMPTIPHSSQLKQENSLSSSSSTSSEEESEEYLSVKNFYFSQIK